MIKWRPNRGITFNRWDDCPRCGLSWPEKALTREAETGAKVCPECLDKPCHADNKAKGEAKTTDTRQSSPWQPD